MNKNMNFNPTFYRQGMGDGLKAMREQKGLSAYRVAKRGGISPTQVKIVEEGTTNYTIDIFLGYIRGCGLYVYFEDKPEDKDQTLDIDDMLSSMGNDMPTF